MVQETIDQSEDDSQIIKYDFINHTTTKIPIVLEYKQGDILLLPIPNEWSVDWINKYQKYIKQIFPEFEDIRLVPNMAYAQILRKYENNK